MDEIIELIITLAGLFIYWWFTSGNFNKKKSKQVQPPSPEGTFIPPSEVIEEEEEEEPVPTPTRRTATPVADSSAPAKPQRKPSLFSELLRQYEAQMEAAQRAQEAAQQAKQEAAAKKRTSISGAEQDAKGLAYTPMVSQRNLEAEALRQKRNAKSVMDEPEKSPDTHVKRRNPLANLLSSPEDIRKALIMKEILDRKHFEI